VIAFWAILPSISAPPFSDNFVNDVSVGEAFRVMLITKKIQTINPQDLPGNLRRLWKMWKEHKGGPSLLDHILEDFHFKNGGLLFHWNDDHHLHAEHIGPAVQAREAEAKPLPSSFLDVYVPDHRPHVSDLFKKMVSSRCGNTGFVERRVADGQTPMRSRYICLPIIEHDGSIRRFANMDTSVTFSHPNEIPCAITLPAGFTRLTGTSLAALPA